MENFENLLPFVKKVSNGLILDEVKSLSSENLKDNLNDLFAKLEEEFNAKIVINRRDGPISSITPEKYLSNPK